MEPTRVLLLSDANIANLASALRSDPGEPRVEVDTAAYGSVEPVLLDGGAEVWARRPDLCVVWTRPEAVLPGIAAALGGERVDPTSIDAEVDAWVDLLALALPRTRALLVPTWTVPFGGRGLGTVDLHEPGGTRALVWRANQRLLDRLRDLQGAWVADGAAWQAAAGAAARDRRPWYAAKIPHATATFRAAASDIKAFLRASRGRTRKLLILDLDNTLWGGVVGETGWQGLRLGGHDPVGEAFVAFQQALRALSRRGVALAIVSKNEESVALEAIRSHPEMVLRETDFAGWRINWRDKGSNIAELLEELRLGADAAVFLDDQPAERAQASAAHPALLVPEWSEDPLASAARLDDLACFDSLGVSDEDVNRTQSYAAERQRRSLQSTTASFDEWLARLEVRVAVEPLGPSNLARAAQLLNKTNQMNLATRRLSEAELDGWAAGADRAFYTFRVADRFSDFGLTGLLSVECRGDTATIEDFVLSCRVMSRRVEEAMLHIAVEHARDAGARVLEAVFRPTERNAPMRDFWANRSGFDAAGDGRFRWDLTRAHEAPPAVLLEKPERAIR